MKISQSFESTIDYPGKFGQILFTPGCNLKCGSCHNAGLVNNRINSINLDKLMKDLQIKTKTGWYDGICISGGEPTTQKDLPEFASKLKSYGLDIKLDTNGANPEMLEKLLSNNLIDYVAMDIKGPKELYPLLVGIKKDYINEIEKSMKILTNSNTDYEFRTTVVPVMDKNTNTRWINIKDYKKMANWIINATQSNKHKHYLQKFVAREKNEMLDEKFSKENLPVEFHETPNKFINRIQESIKDYLPYCEIR